MRPYEQLTERGQVRRLRVLARDALRHFGVPEADFSLLHHWENTTFRVDVPAEATPWSMADRFVPGRYLLRLHRPVERTRAHIESELAWLAALSEDGRVTVPVPMRTVDGHAAFAVRNADYPALGGDPGGVRVCSLLRWMPGRMMRQAGRRLDHMRRVGRVMAELHRHAETWRPASKPQRWRWDGRTIMGRDASVGIAPDVWDELPEDEYRLHATCERRLLRAMETLGEGKRVFGLIHSDLHFANVLFADGQARPIDFDDCAFGHHLYDIATTLLGFDKTPGEWPWRDAFMEGYGRVRELPEETLRYLDLFTAARQCTLLLWCRTSARTNPAFRATLPRWRKAFLPDITRLLELD